MEIEIKEQERDKERHANRQINRKEDKREKRDTYRVCQGFLTKKAR